MALSIVPQVWQNFVLEQLPTLNNVINQGFVQMDTAPAAGDQLVRMPMLDNIYNYASASKITTSSTPTASALTDYQENAVVIHREFGLKLDGLNPIIQGVDLLNMVGTQISSAVIKDQQDFLAAATTGVFTSALSSTHTYDVSAVGAGTIDEKVIIDALQTKIGEALTNIDGMIVHSKVYADLVKLGFILNVQAPVFINGVVTSGNVPTFMGKRVYINDTMCAVSSSTYPTFLVTGQPWYVGIQKNMTIEPYRDVRTGGGTNEIWVRYHFAVGFRGVSYTSATMNPDTSDLTSGAAWTTKATDAKLIKCVKLVTK